MDLGEISVKGVDRPWRAPPPLRTLNYCHALQKLLLFSALGFAEVTR